MCTIPGFASGVQTGSTDARLSPLSPRCAGKENLKIPKQSRQYIKI